MQFSPKTFLCLPSVALVGFFLAKVCLLAGLCVTWAASTGLAPRQEESISIVHRLPLANGQCVSAPRRRLRLSQANHERRRTTSGQRGQLFSPDYRKALRAARGKKRLHSTTPPAPKAIDFCGRPSLARAGDQEDSRLLLLRSLSNDKASGGSNNCRVRDRYLLPLRRNNKCSSTMSGHSCEKKTITSS